MLCCLGLPALPGGFLIFGGAFHSHSPSQQLQQVGSTPRKAPPDFQRLDSIGVPLLAIQLAQCLAGFP
ncbi:protein of unknown function [Thiomonas sp. Bio17B3]|nr:protein of unknown function [Thiomonas sp. Bio17B3]VDY09117.1 protein of unknown function [Thiomonas sp. Sup16B3]VDY11956.1 protein of unknown function [Thiomonas sp. OC7]VDY18827.1 protein of unknown function [Thiomonas sp. CB2]